MLTMKISYERLNQIIEEEVVRFKKINEAKTQEEILVNQIEGYLLLLARNKKVSDLTSILSDVKRRAEA